MASSLHRFHLCNSQKKLWSDDVTMKFNTHFQALLRLRTGYRGCLVGLHMRPLSCFSFSVHYFQQQFYFSFNRLIRLILQDSGTCLKWVNPNISALQESFRSSIIGYILAYCFLITVSKIYFFVCFIHQYSYITLSCLIYYYTPTAYLYYLSFYISFLLKLITLMLNVVYHSATYI